MPEMYLRQPRYTYRARGLFTKSKTRGKNSDKQEALGVFTCYLDKMIILYVFEIFYVIH